MQFYEQGEIAPDLFRHTCKLGLEGLVSKHRERPYRAGRSPHWIKAKNPKHPAMRRVRDALPSAEVRPHQAGTNANMAS